MLLALDFDGTFLSFPGEFSSMAALFAECGHEIVTVTARRKTLENEQAMRAAGVTWPIVFAYDKPKALAAKEAGYDLAQIIWIDDAPHTIGKWTESLAVESVWESELRRCYEVLRKVPLRGQEELFDLRERLKTVCGEE